MNIIQKINLVKIFTFIILFVTIGLFISNSFNKRFSNNKIVVSPDALWESHQIKGLQSSLANIGFYSGPIDGVFNRLTKKSIREFQKTHGISPTGVISSETINEINESMISDFISNRSLDINSDSDNNDDENLPMLQMMGGGTNCGVHFIDPGQSGMIDVPYQVHAYYDPTSNCLWDIDSETGKVIDFYIYNWDWQVGGVGSVFVSENPPEGLYIPPNTTYLTGTIIPTGNSLVEGFYMTPSNWIGTKNGQPSSYMGFWLSYSPGFSNVDTEEMACLQNVNNLLIFLSTNEGEIPPPLCSQIENYNASNYICEPPVLVASDNTPTTISKNISGNQLVYQGLISSNSPGQDTPCDVLIESVTVGLFADGITLASFDVSGSEGVFTDTGFFETPLIDTFSLGTSNTTKLELSTISPDNSETISVFAKDIIIPPGISNVTAGILEAKYKFLWEPNGISRKAIFTNALQNLSVVE